MRELFLPALFIAICLQSIAQSDTSYLYFNENWMEANKENAYYYSKVYNEDGVWKSKNYWMNTNELFSEISYLDKDRKKPTGTAKEYFKSGALKDSAQYENGIRKAVWYYYENGKKRSFASYYKKGKVIEQTGWDETGNELKDFVVEKEAQFPGGPEGWRRYLEQNLNALVTVKDRAPEGIYRVKVQFIIDKEGKVSNVKAVSVPEQCPSCGKEAERIIRKGPKWIPAMQNGEPVIYKCIQFVTYQVATSSINSFKAY